MAKDKAIRDRERLERLCELMRGRKSMLIVMQDFPDPDAVSAAAALKELARVMAAIPVSVACGGAVGRSENKELVRYMDINLLRIRDLDLAQYDLVAMVDTQPKTGNNALSSKVMPDIVIDHHPISRITRRCAYHDIRKHYGATATILYEYLKTAGIPPSTQLATALVYGIRSDTDDLGREISQFDVDAFVDLYPYVNHRIMGRIQVASLPKEYFEMLHYALISARQYGRCVVANLCLIENPDMIGEVADLLLRTEGCDWALCFGYFEGRMLLSLRTSVAESNAGVLMRKIVWRKGTGGGHGAMSGGQIAVDLEDQPATRKLERLVLSRLLKQTGDEGARAERLISSSS